MVRYFLSYYF